MDLYPFDTFIVLHIINNVNKNIQYFKSFVIFFSESGSIVRLQSIKFYCTFVIYSKNFFCNMATSENQKIENPENQKSENSKNRKSEKQKIRK